MPHLDDKNRNTLLSNRLEREELKKSKRKKAKARKDHIRIVKKMIKAQSLMQPIMPVINQPAVQSVATGSVVESCNNIQAKEQRLTSVSGEAAQWRVKATELQQVIDNLEKQLAGEKTNQLIAKEDVKTLKQTLQHKEEECSVRKSKSSEADSLPFATGKPSIQAFRNTEMRAASVMQILEEIAHTKLNLSKADCQVTTHIPQVISQLEAELARAKDEQKRALSRAEEAEAYVKMSTNNTYGSPIVAFSRTASSLSANSASTVTAVDLSSAKKGHLAEEARVTIAKL